MHYFRLSGVLGYLILLTLSTLPGSTSADNIFTAHELNLIQSFGPWPVTTPADAGNELSGLPWAETLGEQLFNDPDLSASQKISCASCHQRHLGFSDGLAVAQGAKKHVRNTQGLLNSGLHYWFGWDGGTDSLWSAAMRPLLSEIEMAVDIDLLAERLRTKDYFISALILAADQIDVHTKDNESLVVIAAKAIAAYTRTLMSGTTPFDRFRDALISGELAANTEYSAAARRGLKIFLGNANCHVCHFGPNFSNAEFHDTGRPFFTSVGQVDSGRYAGIKRVRNDRYNLAGKYNGTEKASEIRKLDTVKLGQVNFGQWKTPSLRNLKLTGPYMHDGSLSSLRDVVDAYADIDPARLHSKGESILKPLDLTEQGRQDLVAFLESLSEN